MAASLLQGSDLHIVEVGANPTRIGFLDVLARMGAAVRRRDTAPVKEGGDPLADLLVRPAALTAVEVAAEEVPGLIDEVPILALAASRAQGVSRFRGLSELRHKESDRLAGIAALLTAFGADARVEGDDLVVTGPCRLKAARVDSGGDHRMAMTALVAGALAEGETTVERAECVDISYPMFYEDFTRALQA